MWWSWDGRPPELFQAVSDAKQVNDLLTARTILLPVMVVLLALVSWLAIRLEGQ